VVLGVVVCTTLGIVFFVKWGDPRWLFLSLPLTLMLLVLGRYAPTGYRLAPDGVAIERRAGPRLIPYRRIRGVDREPRSIVGLSTFGSRGIFGYFGRFWNMRLGMYRLYLSNRQSVVWLATDEGWVGLSPDGPDEFVDAVRARLAPAR
jgi:hypothetical protein